MKLCKVVRLQPNTYQEQMFKQFAGTNRFAWNESKAFYDKVWEDNKEYASIQNMIEHLQALKRNNPDYEWLNTIPETITKQAIKDLQKAYKKAYKDRKTHKPDRMGEWIEIYCDEQSYNSNMSITYVRW